MPLTTFAIGSTYTSNPALATLTKMAVNADGSFNLPSAVNLLINQPINGATWGVLQTSASVSLSLNGATFNSTTNKTITVTETTVASNPVTTADIYIALQLPGGTLLVMQPNGSFSTAVRPHASNVVVQNFTGPIFSYSFNGTEPPGAYKWYAALTTPGTLQVIGTLATAPFNFAP